MLSQLIKASMEAKSLISSIRLIRYELSSTHYIIFSEGTRFLF